MKRTAEMVQDMVSIMSNGKISLVIESFQCFTKKCLFIDCDYGEWYATPHNIITHKQNHPGRRTSTVSKKLSMPIEDVAKKLSEHYGHPVQMIKYTSVSKPVEFMCRDKLCSFASVSVALRGNHFLVRPVVDLSEVKRKLKIAHPEVQIIEETYSGMMHKCDFIHNGVKFSHSPYQVINALYPNRQEANKAKGLSKRITIDVLKAKLAAVHGDEIAVDEETLTHTKDKARFIDSNYGEFWALPNNVMNGSRHPSRAGNSSKGENELFQYLSSVTDLKINKNDRSLIKELDLFIPETKLAIEYSGLYWHSEIYKSKEYHRDKRVLCETNNIRLIQLWDYEWKTKPSICKSIILSRMGLISNKIFARKCEIIPINQSLASTFLKENHLMGSIFAKHIGAFYQGELISVFSYKKKNDGVDCVRFCSKVFTQASGVLSRFFKWIEVNTEAKSIYYWIDLRYGNGLGLEKMGFKRKKETLGFWWTDGTNIFNRLACKADKENGLTEAAVAADKKWIKIWDAGQLLMMKVLR